MHQKNIFSAGKNISEAKKVLILLHGRGARAQDILSLADHFPVEDFAHLAPQATNNTWYPYSFLARPEENEPWLSSALDLLFHLLEDVQSRGIPSEHIYFTGFSQGACLTAEFVNRNVQPYGGIMLFTGGLIGDSIQTENYKGDFNQTPVYIGSGDPDAHVPVERIHQTAQIMETLNARVRVNIIAQRPHTVSPEEIREARQHLFDGR